MKRMGYSPRFAGAVEATASTGGQNTPPIMGAAAFIMAEMIGIPYILYTMIACTILGSGLPTTATYIILSMIAAPALRDFQIPLLVSHMFVLYYGVLADVTPPVALAAYAGAGLAGSNPFRTGFTAFKLALAKAVVPFAFVYSPMLLLQGFQWGIGLIAIFSSALGVIALGAGAVGYLNGKLAVWERILMILSTMLLMVPGLVVKGLGAGLFFLLVLYQSVIRNR